MKIALVNPKTKEQILGPLELLGLLDSTVHEIQANLSDMEGPAVDTSGIVPVYTMSNPEHWVHMVQTLAVTGKKKPRTAVPCVLLVGRNGIPVEVTGDPDVAWSERAHFQLSNKKKLDLNYEKVAKGFNEYLPSWTDRSIALRMLEIMMGTEPPPEKDTTATDDARSFLAGMVALMFGVEASRFPSSIITSVLLLDLIKGQRTYGREGTKPFTLYGAFHSTTWDDTEWYGGKYPYAVHATGSGNMVMRNEMAGGRDLFVNFAKLSQRHAVPRREVSLLVHWLESQHDDEALATLTAEGVKNALLQRLKWVYVDKKIPIQKQSPRRDTGTHFLKLGELKERTRSGVVFWYSGGYYYHYNVGCKLFPLHDEGFELYMSEFAVAPELLKLYETKKEDLKPHEIRAVENHLKAKIKIASRGSLQKGTASQAKDAKKLTCPKCGQVEGEVARELAIEQKKREQEEKKKKDPYYAWKTRFEAAFQPLLEGKTVTISAAEAQKLSMDCPTEIRSQYNKRLYQLVQAALKAK